jgi:hypothetical protein
MYSPEHVKSNRAHHRSETTKIKLNQYFVILLNRVYNSSKYNIGQGARRRSGSRAARRGETLGRTEVWPRRIAARGGGERAPRSSLAPCCGVSAHGRAPLAAVHRAGDQPDA